MLGQVGKTLSTILTSLLVVRQLNSMNGLLVGVEDRSFVENFVAQIAGIENLDTLLGVGLGVLRLDVPVKMTELLLTVRTGLPHPKVNHSLVSCEVILLGKCLQTNVTDVLGLVLDVVSLQFVSF